MRRRPPRSTRTDTLFPFPALFRSFFCACLTVFPIPVMSSTRPPVASSFLFRHSVPAWKRRSEEHTSELQSLMRISYAVFCLKKQRQDKRVHRLRQQSTTGNNHI